MPITPLTALPPRNNPLFADGVEVLLDQIVPFAAEATALEVNVNAKEASAVAAATAATTKAGEALTSANNAATSKTDADTARNAAQTARAAAELALDSFDDRYLGPKAAAPALDNDGNVLLIGALYWDTTISGMRAYNSAVWVTLPGATSAARLFAKADASTVSFTKTASGTVSIKAGTYIDIAGTLLTFAAATAVTMPALTEGTDYAIYACADGSIRADASFSAPTGYTSANSRKIGGFHYSPGGHSGVSGGGNAVAQINEYSLWDLKFKPACLDPRGMALVADGFWADIYLLGVDHLTNGSSKYNVTIADGASPPKVPAKFGGNGTTAYTSLNWWEAGEVMSHHGKRLPNYTEFAALAFGTTEASSIGADPGSTTWAAAYISKWGCAQVSGNLWQWGANFGGGTAASGWVVNTVGRGSTYQLENAAFFGGTWDVVSDSGSRASVWNNSPVVSGSDVGARGVCDLLILE